MKCGSDVVATVSPFFEACGMSVVTLEGHPPLAQEVPRKVHRARKWASAIWALHSLPKALTRV